MLEVACAVEPRAHLGTSVYGEHVGAGAIGSSALVAPNVRPICERAITNIGRRVGGELDRVIVGGTRELSDVFEGALNGAADNGVLEEVVSRGHLSDGQNDGCVDLHLLLLDAEDFW